MGSGLCFFDVCNPQKYLFINKSNYYIRFDFFNQGTKYGVILLPIKKAMKIKEWITDISGEASYKKKYSSEVGKNEYFLIIVNRQEEQTIKLAFESYRSIKCTVTLDQQSAKHFIHFISE